MLPRAAELLAPHAAQGAAGHEPVPALAHAGPARGRGGAAGPEGAWPARQLAVIEAMKMENILVAAQDGTVSELLAKKGESLSVDQPILSFA
jgi:hypothetical protein